MLKFTTTLLAAIIVTAFSLIINLVDEKAIFVSAWGCEGHALVASVAHQWLLKNVRSREFRDIVYTFLDSVTNRALSYDGHPFPRLFPKDFDAKAHLLEDGKPKKYYPPVRNAFSTVSCLADDLRSSTNPKWTSRANWHFAEGSCFPIDNTTTKCPPQKPEGEGRGQIIPALTKIISRLQNLTATGALAAGTPEAAENFAYLLHLVADAHQPLHSCSAAGKEFRKFYSKSQLKKFQEEMQLSEEFGDFEEDDDDFNSHFEEMELSEEEKEEKKKQMKLKSDATVEPTDRGGNFWCVDGGRKNGRNRRGGNKAFCKKSLHHFFDSIAGFAKEGGFTPIVNGTGGGANDCLGCEDNNDVECCLNEPAQSLLEYAFDQGDMKYFNKLKSAHVDPIFWIEELEETCRSTKFDKIRIEKEVKEAGSGDDDGDADDQPPVTWKDGEPLVPGEELPEEYKNWAKDLLKKRLVLAGFRLGYIIREFYFKKAPGDFPAWSP